MILKWLKKLEHIFMNEGDNMTATDRLLSALESGQELTTRQIASRYNLTPSGVSSIIANLRASGYAVYDNNGTYRLGTPSKNIVAAAYQARGAAAFA